MTELPTLQAAIRETAERTYARKPRRRLVPALLTAAAIAVALLVIHDRDARQPAQEVTATPTATVVLTPVPVITRPHEREIPKLSAKELTPTPVDPHDPSLKEATSLLDPAHQVLKAWYVPGLKGHVLLTRKGDEYCLSAPDPLSDQPDVERGVTCTPPARRAKHGDYIGIGNVVITLAPGADTPKIHQR
jgi:hypothetical protein